MPGVLWGARLGLLTVFVLHVGTAIKLSRANSDARPAKYAVDRIKQASSASLYMAETGIVVFIFVMVHLAHFTIGVLQPESFSLHDALGRHDAYNMVVRSFQNPAYAFGYVIAMVMVAIHLSHGIWSFFQTLGFYQSRLTPVLQTGAKYTAYLIALGFISIPVAVQLGLIKFAGGV